MGVGARLLGAAWCAWLAVGCYASHERTAEVEADPACCTSGTFQIVDGGFAGTVIELDDCGLPPGERWCAVDGVEVDCGVGHGTLLFTLPDGGSGTGIQIPITECLGPESTAYVGGATMAGAVTLRRLAP